MSFQAWLDDADMPQRDEEGKWYDAETGIYYASSRKSTKVTSKTALDARELAKFFGGKALKGVTAKQKAAGEIIRAEKVKGVSNEIAELLCTLQLYENASFWLNNKNKSSSEFEAFTTKRIELLAKHKKAKSERDADAVKAIAAEYNDLTKAWGFN